MASTGGPLHDRGLRRLAAAIRLALVPEKAELPDDSAVAIPIAGLLTY